MRTLIRPTGFVDSPFGYEGKITRLAGGLNWFGLVELVKIEGGKRVSTEIVPVEGIEDRFDEAMTDRQARAFERGVPRARVLRWPHASHYLFLTRQADVIKAMNTAWSQSGNGGMMLSSGQGGVEAGFNVNGTPSNYKIDQKYTNEINQMSLRFNNLNSPMPTFSNFHVHPKGHDGNNGAPSTPKNNAAGNSLGDTGAVDKIYNATGQAIQIYVMSRFGLSMYDPRTKQTTQLRKGLDFLDAKKPCP